MSDHRLRESRHGRVRAVKDALSGVRFVFFDFSGTLADGVPSWEHPQIVAGAEHGLAVTPAQVKAAIWEVWGPIEGCTHVEASCSEESYRSWIGGIERRILAGLSLPTDALDAAVERVTELQVAPASHQVYPDVVPTLEALRRRGLRLGLVSNHAWRLPELIAGLGLAPYFEVVLTSARSGYRKPRPEIFHQALATVGARSEAALYIGDDPVCDVSGARDAGLRPIWLNRSGKPDPGVGAPIIRGLDELVESQRPRERATG